MKLNVAKELEALQLMTPAELRDKYAEVFREQSRSGHKAWLIRRIIWRMQALAEGDLSERARVRALEIANDADLRVMKPRPSRARQATALGEPCPYASQDHRLPQPGSVITREYKGHLLQVLVREKGFEFEGIIYRTLTGLAKKITGTHTNGYLFFRLGSNGGDR